ncbi:MAG: single-stranded DNA-binding protein [Candidatus Levyibacteriota bacterium]
MARSLNRVQLIGNLTRDPELRYTPSGTPVCTFGLATNRNWTTDSGEKKDEAEFHRIVAWNKLAELCSQFLVKGRKVYLEGRLATRSWQAQDGTQKNATEVVISDMILLDSKRPEEDKIEGTSEEAEVPVSEESKKKTAKNEDTKETKLPEEREEEVAPDDIPF